MEIDFKNYCQKWKIKELSVFGSVLSDKFNTESDIDILVSFKNNTHFGLFELVEMKEELESMFGNKVDFVTRKSVEKSPNYFRSKAILSNLKLLYAER